VRLDEHENALCQLGRGAYFGEIALLQRSKRTSHVIALTLCDLASLSGAHFRYLMRMFPEHEKTIAKIASERNAQVDYHSDEQVSPRLSRASRRCCPAPDRRCRPECGS
jgi:CRP-like cAMP-binding protein